MSMFKVIPVVALILAACAPSMTGKDSASANGLLTRRSPHSVTVTLDRVAAEAAKLNFAVVNRIDHAKAAQATGQTLRPTELLLVGNPVGGTPLMQCAQTVGIDLPMKYLAYQDSAGQTWLTYNDPTYLMNRHAATGCDEAFKKANNALNTIAENALKP